MLRRHSFLAMLHEPDRFVRKRSLGTPPPWPRAFALLYPEPVMVNRHLRVVFSKAEPGSDYVEIARGAWMLGREPELTGEPIPPEVLKGIEKQTPAFCDHSRGIIRYARAGVLYAMDFEAIEAD